MHQCFIMQIVEWPPSEFFSQGAEGQGFLWHLSSKHMSNSIQLQHDFYFLSMSKMVFDRWKTAKEVKISENGRTPWMPAWSFDSPRLWLIFVQNWSFRSTDQTFFSRIAEHELSSSSFGSFPQCRPFRTWLCWAVAQLKSPSGAVIFGSHHFYWGKTLSLDRWLNPLLLCTSLYPAISHTLRLMLLLRSDLHAMSLFEALSLISPKYGHGMKY